MIRFPSFVLMTLSRFLEQGGSELKPTVRLGQTLLLKSILLAVLAVTGAGSLPADAAHPQTNVFMFGDSTSDPGNELYEPFPLTQIAQSIDVPVPIFPFSPTTGTLQVRYNPDGVPCDGINFPQMVAKKLKLNYLRGSQVTRLNKPVGNFVNFSISGATQDSNSFVIFGLIPAPPVTSPQYGSYGWEVQNFSDLIANSPEVSISPDDIFFYYSTGANEVLLRYYFGAPTDQTYVDAFKENIAKLYSMGMRRLILGLQTAPNAANSPVLQLAAGGASSQLALQDASLNAMQAGVLGLDFAALWPGLQVSIHRSGDYLADVFEQGKLQVGSYPNLNTEAGRGFWPVSSALPTNKGKHLPFIDDLHFTEYANEFLAKDVLEWFDAF